MNKILEMAQNYYEYTRANRRHFHQHPELSHQEFATTDYIIRELERAGIEYERPCETGVVAIIRGCSPAGAPSKEENASAANAPAGAETAGNVPARAETAANAPAGAETTGNAFTAKDSMASSLKTIGLRGDIDALPIREMTEVPYRSENDGVMHACGHDAHGAALLTAALMLQDLRNSFSGTVKCIFQAAEEYLPSGSLAVIQSGVLDDCDGFFGMHVSPQLEEGRFSVTEGPVMAASEGFHIKIKGKGGHGGRPEEAIDATVAAAALVMNLQTIVSRELSVNNPAVLSIGELHSGSSMNAISEEAEMHGTCRFFDPGQEALFRERITAVAENTAASFRAKAEVSIVPGCPAVINDVGMCAIAREAVSELLGPEAVASLPKSCTNEDFSYYGQLAPSVMLWAGTAGPGREYPLHSPYFDLEEQALISMPAMHVQFALDFLGCREE